jgi:uncharacterized protein
MVHPQTALRYRNERIGYGVFATRKIPRGTIVWVRDPLDQTFTPAQAERLPKACRAQLATYAYTDKRGDLLLCWDHARFFNHSCAASCLAPGYEFEVAVRDIEAGDELTDDYATFSLDTTFECACGAPACRGTIRPDDVLRFGDDWDRQVRDALAFAKQVEQPLWPLVAEARELERSLADEIPLPSVRTHVRPSSLAWGDR